MRPQNYDLQGQLMDKEGHLLFCGSFDRRVCSLNDPKLISVDRISYPQLAILLAFSGLVKGTLAW